MKYLYFAIFFIANSYALSQDFTIVEQLAQEDSPVTARSMGLAGAFSAVGADFSNGTSNPAGLAFTRKKELGLGLGYQIRKAKPDYLGSIGSGESNDFQLNNIGYTYATVFTEWVGDSLQVRKKGLVGAEISLGLNQMAEYDESFSNSHFNPNNSLMTSYTRTANEFATSGPNFLDPYEQQAYTLGLLEANNPISPGSSYYYDSPYSSGQMDQSFALERTGSRKDLYLNGGLNFNHKLYVGLSLLVPFINFDETKSIKEKDINGLYTNFENYRVSDRKNYSGAGGAVSLGGIYRFNDYFRIGAHFKSKSSIDIDQYSEIYTSVLRTSEQQVSSSFDDNYTLNLPWRGGLQFVASHPEYGLLSIEGEYIDYESSSIEFFEEDLNQNNEYIRNFKNDINTYYRGTINGKAGLEFRIAKQYRVRGGIGYYGSPYQKPEYEYGANYDKLVLGLGLGAREKHTNIMIDVAYNYGKTGETVTAYTVGSSLIGSVNQEKSHNFALNLTKRFNK